MATPAASIEKTEEKKTPTAEIGSIVHFVATDNVLVGPDGSRQPDIRAMIVCGVEELTIQSQSYPELRIHGLVLRNSQTDPCFAVATERWYVQHNEENHFARGSWHWPPSQIAGLAETLHRALGITYRRIEMFIKMTGKMNEWLDKVPGFSESDIKETRREKDQNQEVQESEQGKNQDPEAAQL